MTFCADVLLTSEFVRVLTIFLDAVLLHKSFKLLIDIRNQLKKGWRLKVTSFIYRHLQGNLLVSSLQFDVAYWPTLALSSAAQLAAAHYPKGLWTRSLQLDRPTYAPASYNYGLHAAVFCGNDSLFLVASITTTRY